MRKFSLLPHIFARVLLCAAALALLPVSGIADSLLPVSGTADPPAQCNANLTSCLIPEDVLLQLPFLAISGDVILLDPQTITVSDVFRIFNNVVNTGQGTGLGNMAFLFSSDDSTPLPNPATYSANAVTIMEDPSGSTHYVADGRDYLLNPVPEPGTFGLLGLGIGLMALVSCKAPRIVNSELELSPEGESMHRSLLQAERIVAETVRRRFMLTGFVVWGLLGCVSAFGQDDIPVIDVIPSSSGTYSNAIGSGPVSAESFVTPAAAGLAFFTDSYNSLGSGLLLPFNIVGTNPADGAATTTIPVVIVPIRVVYQTAGGVALDGTNVIPAVQNSPIFLTADYTVGGTDLGVTQYGDALQRGQFWQLPGFSQNYHVLLGTPSIAPTITVTVANSSQGNLYRLTTGTLVGVVATSYLNSQLNAQISNYTANVLPIFLTDNVYEGSNGTINTCCILGYHNSQGPPAATAKTWIYAAYTEAGTFSRNVILDVQALSHEVAEWLNDPFVGAFAFGFLNIVPPAMLPGQSGACIINFETGDPLEAPPSVFTQVINGTTYHLQDEVFLPWYLHTSPSFSVNGWYTLMNTFTSFSTLCGPG